MSQFLHFKIAECQLPTRGSWNCFCPTNDDDVYEDDNSDEDKDGDEDDDA